MSLTNVPGVLLSFLFMIVESIAVPLSMKFDMLALRHVGGLLTAKLLEGPSKDRVRTPGRKVSLQVRF